MEKNFLFGKLLSNEDNYDVKNIKEFFAHSLILNPLCQKISPFEPVFPKQLYKDIIGYHFDPDTPPNTLIFPQRSNISFNVVLIEKDQPFNDNCMLDCRDGFAGKHFHELCYNKGSTIMIPKVHKLIRGYNPLKDINSGCIVRVARVAKIIQLQQNALYIRSHLELPLAKDLIWPL
ncbi:11539_t:CDS:2 [Funneliformis geosporum]|nr:11539_t:CDS:2 [Funneliformis geosporum]